MNTRSDRRGTVNVVRLACGACPLYVALGAQPAAWGEDQVSWLAVAAGVERLRLTDGDAECLRFDLARYRVDVVVTGAERPLTAAELRAENEAVLAVNGGFFDTDGRPLGLRIAGGRRVLGLRPRVDWGVLIISNERARIVHSRDYREDKSATAAVQVGPRLLVDGRPLPLKPQSARRTAIALDKSGRSLTVVVTRARVSAQALAQTLAGLGFDSALMLDGGPSSQLSAAVGDTKIEIPGGYGVPDGLVIRPKR